MRLHLGCVRPRLGWIGATLLLAAGLAQAQSPAQSPDLPAPPPGPSTASPITDHLAFSAFYFWGLVDTHARFDTPQVEGTPFSAEDQLGLTNQAHQALVELMIRMEQRNRLRFDFLDVRRQGAAVLEAPLQFGSTLFPAGEPVQSELDWRETDFTYTWSFLRDDRFEVGFGPGLHLVQAYASGYAPHTSLRQVYTAAGPFATLALDGTWRFARHWSLNARGQFLRLGIDQSSGELGDYHADVQYRWRAALAFGLGYEYRRVQVDIRNANPSGFVQLNISGPELFARLAL